MALRHITYHYAIPKAEDVTSTIRHEILNEELQVFIEGRGEKQEQYFFFDNGFFWFLYLDNGNRIDVML